MAYNVTKLDAELRAAGLDIHGVRADGSIDWVAPPTAQQLATAASVLAAHDPVDHEASVAETARRDLGAMVAAAIADYDTALAHWATLDQAQLKAVVKRNAQVCRALLIYLRREFH